MHPGQHGHRALKPRVSPVQQHLVRGAGVALLLAAMGCSGDDIVYRTCGTYEANWHGVKCFMSTNCASCHAAQHTNPPVFTVLPDAIERDLLEGNGIYVVPGDPQASKLWRVISGNIDPQRDTFGIMPWGYDEPLPRSETEHVRQWIEAGAPLTGVK